MTVNIATTEQPAMTGNVLRAAILAGITGSLGWGALMIECHRSVTSSLAEGRGLAEAIFLFLRFFTILTNIGIAVLMSVTFVRLLSRRRPLPAIIFNAGLTYIFVTCVTYEIILRSQMTLRGLQFYTDAIIHDIVPGLMLLFWLGFAPREGASWRDALWILVYPALYFAMTLAAGAFGEGYPYNFLDVDRLGLPAVLTVALMFLAVFYVLGLVTTALSMSRRRADARGQNSM